MMSKIFALAAGLVALVILPTLARADCSAPGFNPSNVFCDGCTYEGHMSLGHDQACVRPYLANAGSGSAQANAVEIIDHRLVERAKHGIAGLNATTMAYSPAKAYVGKDEFTIEVLCRQGGKYHKFLVHWNVSVN